MRRLPNRRAARQVVSCYQGSYQALRCGGDYHAGDNGVMNEFQATTVMVVLFTLRCVLPVVVMAAIAYSMKRLVRHWEVEDVVSDIRHA